jgi:hypothetical protein
VTAAVLVLALILVPICGGLLGVGLSALLRRFRRPPFDPPVVLEFEVDDWCCICLRDLAADEVYEVREHGGIDDHEGGGSWVVRTYCPEHAPPDALAPLPSRG